MLRLVRIFALALAVGVPTALASSSNALPGAWHRLPAAPSAVLPGTTVWTGRQLIVVGDRPFTSTNVAEAYNPLSKTWRRLPLPSPRLRGLGYKAVWTGKEMLVWSAFHSAAFNPKTKQWRSLSGSVPAGIIVWTGREAIGWGGGCCGDASSSGSAYNPTTDRFRRLARSPLAPSQQPLGAWTGRELILFVSGFDPEGKAWPARLARAAAYDPAKNTWRRIPRVPVAGLRFGDTAVWDGSEVLVTGGGANARSAFAYNPTTNQWRRLASLPSGRVGASAVWTGKQLLLWGGQNSGASRTLRGGLAYDPRTNRWSTLSAGPFRARTGSAVAWTGSALLVWGGEIGTPVGTHLPPRFPRDGGSFTPTTT
jgi:Galactose oxidase, central domain